MSKRSPQSNLSKASVRQAEQRRECLELAYQHWSNQDTDLGWRNRVLFELLLVGS